LEEPEAAAAAAQTTRARGFSLSERRVSPRRALGREESGGDGDSGEERARTRAAAVATMVGVGAGNRRSREAGGGRLKRRR